MRMHAHPDVQIITRFKMQAAEEKNIFYLFKQDKPIEESLQFPYNECLSCPFQF